jgi:predicted glutamine amidotransferase
MCRWLAYIGEPRLIEQFLYDGPHSLCEQAQHSHKAKLGVHGDGGGLGWYAKSPVPGLYRDAGPAWADTNLRELTRVIESDVFFAHVRASTGAANLSVNCHPFREQSLLFMHNGQIGGFQRLRRQLLALLSDESFDCITGGTDSELLFQLMITYGLRDNPEHAIRKTISVVDELRRSKNIKEAFRATLALTDGKSVRAVRWASDENAPSLYLNQANGGVLLVSEPLDEDLSKWTVVPANSLMCIEFHNGTEIKVHSEPFLVQNNREIRNTP